MDAGNPFFKLKSWLLISCKIHGFLILVNVLRWLRYEMDCRVHITCSVINISHALFSISLSLILVWWQLFKGKYRYNLTNSEKIDMWGVGTVLYYTLFGQRPFP